MHLKGIHVRPISPSEISRYNDLMQTHHYLGALGPIGETLRYVAQWQNQCIALIRFSSAALKCSARDQWIGWRYRHQFDRTHLVTNNSRFLILPAYHYPNGKRAYYRYAKGAPYMPPRMRVWRLMLKPCVM